MKILQINKGTNYVNKLDNKSGIKKTNTSFKGLWGENDYESYSDREYSHNSTIYNYYPFKDETKQEIKSIVDANSYYNSYR